MTKDLNTDDVHQKLWQRKKLKVRRERNEIKKVRKTYFKQKEQTGEEPPTDNKKQEFADSLFKKEDQPPKEKKAKAQPSFNKSLDRLKQVKEQKVEDLATKKRRVEKEYKQKRRYAHQLNRKTSKGQMRMSGMIDHLLNKIQK